MKRLVFFLTVMAVFLALTASTAMALDYDYKEWSTSPPAKLIGQLRLKGVCEGGEWRRQALCHPDDKWPDVSSKAEDFLEGIVFPAGSCQEGETVDAAYYNLETDWIERDDGQAPLIYSDWDKAQKGVLALKGFCDEFGQRTKSIVANPDDKPPLSEHPKAVGYVDSLGITNGYCNPGRTVGRNNYNIIGKSLWSTWQSWFEREFDEKEWTVNPPNYLKGNLRLKGLCVLGDWRRQSISHPDDLWPAVPKKAKNYLEAMVFPAGECQDGDTFESALFNFETGHIDRHDDDEAPMIYTDWDGIMTDHFRLKIFCDEFSQWTKTIMANPRSKPPLSWHPIAYNSIRWETVRILPCSPGDTLESWFYRLSTKSSITDEEYELEKKRRRQAGIRGARIAADFLILEDD